MSILVDPQIANLVPYVPGKRVEALERELGIARAVKLASNENPRGPSPKACAVLAEAAQHVNRYPDGGASVLRSTLAHRLKVLPEQVIVGNGSDEILGLLAKTFLAPGDEAVMADHTFVVYRWVVAVAHGQAIEVPLRNWCHDLPAMVAAITPRTRLLFICNPNNPTGTIVHAQEVQALMEGLPDDVIVVFDEAYVEYVRSAQYPDSLAYVAQGKPVVVLRTFSKIYGLAGLRIGYGVTTPDIAQYVNRVRPPFNTNSLAQRAAVAALDDEDHVAKSRTLNGEEIERVRTGLQSLGLEVLPSDANFLYVDVGTDGSKVFNALLRRGVIVRHIRGHMIRVTIGLPEENILFLQALQAVLVTPPNRT